MVVEDMEDEELKQLLDDYNQEVDIHEKLDKFAHVYYYLMKIGRYEECREYALSALEESLKIGANNSVYNIYYAVGFSYRSQGDLTNCEIYFKKALDYTEEIQSLRLMYHAYDAYASIMIYSDTKKALEYMLKALEITEHHGIVEQIETTYVNLGSVYAMLEKYDEAMYYFKKALGKSKKQQEQAIIYVNIASLCYEIESYKMAFGYVKKAYKYFKKNNIIKSIVHCLILKGKISLKKEYYTEALNYAEESILITKQHSMQAAYFETLILIINVYTALGDLKKAKIFIDEATELENTIQSDDQKISLKKSLEEYKKVLTRNHS